MAGRTYRYFQGKALYPFGYGLSYTDFAYSSLQIPRKCNQTDKEIKVEVTVKNKGKLAGEEVVQLYISHPGQKVLVSLASLKGFQRVHLKAGESKKLVFLLSDRDLACVDENGHLTMLPGDISIFIGGSSPVPTLTDSLTGVKGIMRMEVVQK